MCNSLYFCRFAGNFVAITHLGDILKNSKGDIVYSPRWSLEFIINYDRSLNKKNFGAPFSFLAEMFMRAV
ncbi:unnamed protein product [Strongylus vulgaris]|uniref:Uncharacterized protein n=1 Tax=Strongylus vulgaris TaxID=40348 RepID=A0A3P7KBV6_STRVU|nr:unnamed protein product [Strongylus vulgaris]